MWSAKNVHGNLITVIFFLICWTHFSFVVADQTEVNLVEEYNALIKIRTGYLKHQKTPATITEEFVQMIRQNKQRHLFCTYLFHSLIHMHLTDILLESDKFTEFTIELIYWFSEPIQKMLSTLYEFGVLKLKAIMSLYLYIKLIAPFPQSVGLNLIQSEGFNDRVLSDKIRTRVIKIHENIYRQLVTVFQQCHVNFVYFDIEKPLDNELITIRIQQNLIDVSTLIERNHYEKSLLYSSYYDMSLYSIFMNDFGCNFEVRSIITRHDVQVNWNGVPEKLLSRWRVAHRFHLMTESLELLISYLTMCIDFLKIFILRFTWIHLKYLDEYRLHLQLATTTETILPRDDNGYVPKWFDILTAFVKLLDLKKDNFFNYLLSSFGKNAVDVYDQLENETLRDHIRLELELLQASFSVSITKPINLDVKSEEIYIFQQHLKKNSINRAESFIDHISSLFKGVNFQIIQTIIELKN